MLRYRLCQTLNNGFPNLNIYCFYNVSKKMGGGFSIGLEDKFFYNIDGFRDKW